MNTLVFRLVLLWHKATPTATTSPALEKVSVDQLTAANAVTDLAEVTNLPVAGDLRETTTTLYIKKQLSQADTEVISKPQIVQPDASSSRGVTTYVAKEGDTMEMIAKQFNISRKRYAGQIIPHQTRLKLARH